MWTVGCCVGLIDAGHACVGVAVAVVLHGRRRWCLVWRKCRLVWEASKGVGKRRTRSPDLNSHVHSRALESFAVNERTVWAFNVFDKDPQQRDLSEQDMWQRTTLLTLE